MSDEFSDTLNGEGEPHVPKNNVLDDAPIIEDELSQLTADIPDDVELGAEYVDLLQLRMGGRDFLLLAGDVTEIVRLMPLTPVPMAPDHLLGMGNIHGQIVCVIEPGKQLALPEPPKPDNDATRYVVLRHKRMRVALRVDAVIAIHRRNKQDLENMQEADAPRLRGRLNVGGVTYDVLHAGMLLQE